MKLKINRLRRRMRKVWRRKEIVKRKKKLKIEIQVLRKKVKKLVRKSQRNENIFKGKNNNLCL